MKNKAEQEEIPTSDLSRLNISVAKIETNIEYLKKGMDDLKVAFKTLADSFITRAEFTEFTKRLDADSRNLADELSNRVVSKDEFDSYKRAFWILITSVTGGLVAIALTLFKMGA